MKNLAIFLFFALTILSSCKDEVTINNSFSNSEEREDDLKINDVAMHLKQIDKRNMLYSLIRWDKQSQNYILDLSTKDAEILGINQDDVQQAIELVDRLNNDK